MIIQEFYRFSIIEYLRQPLNERGNRMNWIKLIIFFIIIFPFYHLAGSWVNRFCRWEKRNTTLDLISGYLFLTFIQWCIGVPAQFFHVSWNSYFYSLLVVYGGLFLFFWKQREKKSFSWLTFIREHWFLLLLAACFSFWSMSSQLPYFQFNYDDHYYLGAIVQSIGSDALASVNYFNGTPMVQGISRIVNTFEIGYGFWASLLHIDPIFFARAVMVIHNYLVIFLAITAAIRGLFHIKDVYAQYCCLPFALFLLPAGYLDQVGKIRLYDGWQMNTAIWYGGSIVRCCALPLCFMYVKNMLDHFHWRKLIFTGMVFCAFLAQSSIFVTFALAVMVLAWIWCSVCLLRKKERRMRLWGALMIAVLIIGMKLGPKLLEIIMPSLTNYYLNAGANISKMAFAYTQANLPFLILSLFGVFTLRHWKDNDFPFICLVVCSACVLLYNPYFNKFVITIAVGYDFVYYRLITALQLFMLALCGYLFTVLWCRLVKNGRWLSWASVLVIAGLNLFNLGYLDVYAGEDMATLTSGLSVYGYAPDRLFQNAYMAPRIFHDLDTYFSKQPDGRYRLVSPHMIRYEDGALFISPGLAIGNGNIESCMSYENVRCDNIEFGEIDLLEKYCGGRGRYDLAAPILAKYHIDYLITDNVQVRDELAAMGKATVLDSVSLAHDHVYLIQLR